ncbi:hypothetical protein C9F11_27825 [Streptomyces sp. YIM 121038]|uniref:hypothetical protein n=1 Tax=Streptomyces sp. YIM 121038 TaxID=2136401 RepID=UPI0011109E71|nr:hypothetical protein [Streptomyces sp. YIM 121038]QCX79165.1 hypothetical protein C9F11_27825 [Streptomyces sp. YIM 121038]
MIVTLIILCEVGFWVLLAGGLALRYWAKMPRTSVAVLLCEPLLEVVLFVVTAVDLKNGAEPDWKHGLAAVYIGYSVALGHYTIKWVDVRVAHRFAGGPPPVKLYGAAHAVNEWKIAARWVLAALIAMGLLQGAIWYVGSDGETGSLRMWQQKMLWVVGINLIIAGSYTLFPKRIPAPGPQEAAGEHPVEAREAARSATADPRAGDGPARYARRSG